MENLTENFSKTQPSGGAVLTLASHYGPGMMDQMGERSQILSMIIQSLGSQEEISKEAAHDAQGHLEYIWGQANEANLIDRESLRGELRSVFHQRLPDDDVEPQIDLREDAPFYRLLCDMMKQCASDRLDEDLELRFSSVNGREVGAAAS